ncbi:MAG: PP2C family protein-serine/threonine phosphatase [Calditrichaceae bacterium]|nr:PP2C family protein-serine/threonine phosphatase [Calditrichaceae bacterium]MBN2709906.1 PP2C family protein-serine/threonine phosphatase [Calditrichaceae bacterium]RQV92660.1 MAG: hypothetical protein EH224_14865 [Calditrichota bacterium]
MNDLIEKLQFEAASYQEGFQLLSKARNLNELAKSFFHIVRGNLMISGINIYYREKNANTWNLLIVRNKNLMPIEEHDDSADSMDSRPGLSLKVSMVDGSAFALLLGDKLNKKAYDDYDRISLQRMAQLLDSSYQVFINKQKEKELVFSLNQKILQLNSLVDTGIEISRLGQGNGILELALNRVVSLTNASKGSLTVTEKKRIINKIFFPSRFKEKPLIKNNEYISSVFKFNGKKYDFKLYQKESRQGVIAFDTTDQLLLDSFARQVNVTLENHFLHEQTLEKQKIEQDISVAAAIQKQIIPDSLPDISGYDIAGVNIPTKFVGGDYYDCILLKDKRYALIVADVSGKGIPAALLVSSLHASLSAYLDAGIDLISMAKKLNMIIYNASTIDKYITFFIALLNPQTGELESLNAGHNQIYLLKAGKKIIELKTGGVPFGMMGIEFPYQTEKNLIESGDRLLLYTDGVTEAMNARETQFEDVFPLDKYLTDKSKADITAKDFIDRLIIDIKDFTGDTPQSDDITALYLIRKA